MGMYFSPVVALIPPLALIVNLPFASTYPQPPCAQITTTESTTTTYPQPTANEGSNPVDDVCKGVRCQDGFVCVPEVFVYVLGEPKFAGRCKPVNQPTIAPETTTILCPESTQQTESKCPESTTLRQDLCGSKNEDPNDCNNSDDYYYYDFDDTVSSECCDNNLDCANNIIPNYSDYYYYHDEENNCNSICGSDLNSNDDGGCKEIPQQMTCEDFSCPDNEECYLDDSDCSSMNRPPNCQVPKCRPMLFIDCIEGYILQDDKCIPEQCVGFCDPDQECYLETINCITEPCPPPSPTCRDPYTYQ